MPDKNIKIISNSDVTGVINMTRDYSYSWVDVGIEYGESLERVESILQDEFPQIVINQPTEFKEATAWEKRKAEEFAKAQRELTQDYVEEDEENR